MPARISPTVSAFVPALAAAPASAGIYRVTGALFDDSPTLRGTFQIDIDEADLTDLLFSSDLPEGSTPPAIDPWQGYDVTDATVTIDGFSFAETGILPSEPAEGGPAAEFYIEGVSIVDLDIENFEVFFEDLDNPSSFALIGFATIGSGPAQTLTRETFRETPSGFGSGNPSFEGAGIQNVNAARIPEPSP